MRVTTSFCISSGQTVFSCDAKVNYRVYGSIPNIGSRLIVRIEIQGAVRGFYTLQLAIELPAPSGGQRKRAISR